MASKTGAVWAVDIGNNSIKALHLTAEHGSVEVIGFENIQHGKVLTGANVKPAERDELIALSLRNFANKHDLRKDDLIVSVPGQNSFARFVNLPPVEKNRIPEIVNFEAVQQIPFDINDVQWDWQLMADSDSPETKVGIFAIKNEVVNTVVEHFSRENLQVKYVQMAPMALYNYLLFDRPDLVKSESQAIAILNIGADNTDLVVCTKSSVWQRSILMGGNTFTKAIADTFKLNFEKAEKLKRTAPVSKYARQIFQAMKPVFTDLVSEVQRSLGFYTSSNPTSKIVKIIALGGGTRLRGLIKYLQQTLQIPIEMPDTFKKIVMGSDVSAAKFHENVCDFGVVYGLGLQGLGLGRIKSNLLPGNIARTMAWASKSKYFTAAASILLLVSLLGFARTGLDKISYARNSRVRQETSNIINEAEQANKKLDDELHKVANYETIIKKEFEPFVHRDVVPLLLQTLFSALPNEKNNPEQKELYEAFNNGDAKRVLDMNIDRKQRKQIFITGISTSYTTDIEKSGFGKAQLRMGSRQGTGTSEADERYLAHMEELEQEKQKRMGRTETKSRKSTTEAVKVTSTQQEKGGFIVTVIGYSPYGDIRELMEPHGAKDDQSKQGFITRLLNHDENSPFILYERTNYDHFKLEINEISLDSEIPVGIGIAGVRYKQTKDQRIEEEILIDPLTREIISKVAVLDPAGKPVLDERTGKEIYEVHDHWFVLNAKFLWKGASKAPESKTPDDTDSSRAPTSKRAEPKRTEEKTKSKEVLDE
jgi:type IV pilus assembly protein PilM